MVLCVNDNKYHSKIEKVRVIKDGKICNISFKEFMDCVFLETMKKMDKIEVIEEK